MILLKYSILQGRSGLVPVLCTQFSFKSSAVQCAFVADSREWALKASTWGSIANSDHLALLQLVPRACSTRGRFASIFFGGCGGLNLLRAEKQEVVYYNEMEGPRVETPVNASQIYWWLAVWPWKRHSMPLDLSFPVLPGLHYFWPSLRSNVLWFLCYNFMVAGRGVCAYIYNSIPRVK